MISTRWKISKSTHRSLDGVFKWEAKRYLRKTSQWESNRGIGVSGYRSIRGIGGVSRVSGVSMRSWGMQVIVRISHCGWRRTSMCSSLFAGEGAILGLISHCGWRRTSMCSSLFAGEGASLGSHLSLRVKAIGWAGFVETNFGEWRAVIGIFLQQISTYSSVRSRTVTVTGHFNWCRTVRPVCWKWSCAHSIEDFVLWLVSSSRFSMNCLTSASPVNMNVRCESPSEKNKK